MLVFPNFYSIIISLYLVVKQLNEKYITRPNDYKELSIRTLPQPQ